MTPWMQTNSGRAFNLINPDPATVDPEDIAHHLSQLCRYAGATQRHYSVAEHCVLIHDYFRLRNGFGDEALGGLFHDAHEAYVADPPSPVMRALSQAARDSYGALRARVDVAICERFGIDVELLTLPAVKTADRRILLDERAAMLGPPPLDWGVKGPPLGVSVKGWPAAIAKAEWLYRLRMHRRDWVDRSPWSAPATWAKP